LSTFTHTGVEGDALSLLEYSLDNDYYELICNYGSTRKSILLISLLRSSMLRAHLARDVSMMVQHWATQRSIDLKS